MCRTILFVLTTLLPISCKGSFIIGTAGRDARSEEEGSTTTGEENPVEATSQPTSQPLGDTAAPTLAIDLLTLAAVEIDDGEITLEWQAAEDETTAAAALTYEVFYSLSDNLQSLSDIKANGLGKATLTGTTTHEFTGLTIDKPYYFGVIAKDAAGNEQAYEMRGPFCGGTGASGDEYEICDPGSLQMIHFYLEGEFVQTNDIDLSATTTWNSNQGWFPIGGSAAGFEGKYNGAQYRISNLWIDRTSSGVGLFGESYEASEMQGIIVEAAHVETTGSNAGIVFGYVGDSGGGKVAVMEDIHTSGTVQADGYVGGIAGSMFGTLTNSSSSADVTSTGSSGGGLVGSYSSPAGGSINQSFASGHVVVTTFWGGGLTGRIAGDIEDSYATGNVYGPQMVGGLVGSQSNGIVRRSYAIGSVHATTSEAGGCLGKGRWTWNVFCAGSVTTAGSHTGAITADSSSLGIAGSAFLDHPFNPSTCNRANTTNCSAKANPSWFYRLDNFGSGAGELDWDFSASGPWIMPQTGKYPVLRWQNPNDPIAFPPEFRNGRKIGFSDMAAYRVWGFCSTPGAAITFTGPNPPADTTCNGGTWEASWNFSSEFDGNIDIGVQQGTAGAVMRQLVKDTESCDGIYDETTNGAIDTRFAGAEPTGGHVICNVEQMSRFQSQSVNHTRNFQLGDNIDLASGYPNAPIATSGAPYAGLFDGNGFVLRNLTTTTGLFTQVGDILTPVFGGVIDLGLEEVEVTGAQHTGAVIGYLSGCSQNIANVYSTGYVTSTNSDVGGLVGQVFSCTGMEGVFSSADVIAGGSNVGGLVGRGQAIDDSFFLGTVKGLNYVGGVSGSHTSVRTTFMRGRVDGDITNGIGVVGALVGFGSAVDSYAEAAVSGGGTVGGLGGYADISRSYFKGSVFGSGAAAGIIGTSNSSGANDNIAFASVFSIQDKAAGVAGTVNKNIANSFWYNPTAALDCIDTNSNASSVECSEFLTPPESVTGQMAPFASWDVTTPVWTFPTPTGLPRLNWETD